MAGSDPCLNGLLITLGLVYVFAVFWVLPRAILDTMRGVPEIAKLLDDDDESRPGGDD